MSYNSERKNNNLEIEEIIEDVLKGTVPIAIQILLEQGLVAIEELHDADVIKNAMDDNPGFFSNANVPVIIEFHHIFIEAAKDAVQAERGAVAIVLLATAIEQSLNTFYRNAFAEMRLFNEDQITEVIRNNNISPKTGWLLTMMTRNELEEKLSKEITHITELRNQIVHYKAKPSSSLNDCDLNGSYGDIEQRIQKLDFNNLLSVPNDLDHFLNEALDNLRCEASPEYKLIKEAATNFIQKKLTNIKE